MAAEVDKDTEVWKQVFQELIQEVKPWHKWTLTLDKGLLPDDLKPGWIQCQQRTFARFRCSSCSRSWASAKILVLFHMHWCREKLRGLVKMRVFAQKCKKCPQRPFEVPEFMKDNITRVLNNLVFKILKKCYREEFQQVEEIPAIGDGCLEGPHDTNNCEACLQGLCVQTGSGLPSKSPTSPLSPILLHPNQEPKVTGTCINRPHSPPPPKKVDKAQASTRKPKAQNPTKTDPPITPQYRISKPITTPTLITQQLPPISSNTSQPPPVKSCLHTSKLSPVGSHIPVLITQIPSPTKSRTEIKVASSSNRLNTGRMSPSSSSSPYAEPTAQNLLAHSIYQVERSPGMYQEGECSCNTCETCAPQNLSCGCCCLILFIFIVGIWLVVKYT